MSDLLKRLKAMRGESVLPAKRAQTGNDPGLEAYALQLDAQVIESAHGVHFQRDVRLPADAQHGRSGLGGAALHPLLLKHLEAEPGGKVMYLDTETTGLSGGTGTLAFLIGVGSHTSDGFTVQQLMLPGPEHELAQLHAFTQLTQGASAVLTYNGGSFDLPLLRSRYALHGLKDPLYGVPHLDLLTPARRLWRETLPDCTLGTVERRVLGAVRELEDVPGYEVPARYTAWLRQRDAAGLRGVFSHNASDIVALSALRAHLEQLVEGRLDAAAPALHGLGLWLERLGDSELALERLLRAARSRPAAAWDASLLLKRAGRITEAAELWRSLGRQGLAGAWVELAKVQEHRAGDFKGALESVAAALHCADAVVPELQRRRARLERRLARAAA